MTIKIAVVTNIPTPYRSALFDAISAQSNVDFLAIYLSTGQSRREQWRSVAPRHRHVSLSGRAWEWREDAAYGGVRVDRELRSFCPHIVVICGWDQLAFWVARGWCRRHAVKTVAWIESHRMSGRPGRRWLDVFRSRFVRVFDSAIVPGTEAAEYVAQLGFSREVLLMPNPVEPPAMGDVSGNERRSHGRGLSLLFLGALSERKNPLHVLKVAEELMVRGVETNVIYAGAGQLSEVVKSMATELGISCEMLGHVVNGDLETVWRRSDCLLVPSHADAAPLVLSEAAARGVPFVTATTCGGASILIERGAAGLRLPLDLPYAEWADAVVRVSDAPRRPLVDVLPTPAARRLKAFLSAQVASEPSPREYSVEQRG